MEGVGLVIPCYNEERRLPRKEILSFLKEQPSAHLCFVNDGSSDGTLAVLDELKKLDPDRMTVLNLRKNCGKAEAVRQGVLRLARPVRFAFIGYWDADLSAPLGELEHLLRTLTSHPACQLVMGSRVKQLGSHIDRRASRHVLGRILSTVSSVLLDLPVYDSQCGAKVFRAEVAEMLFNEPFVTVWLFDLEILARLRRRLGREAALKAAIEVPLNTWVHVPGSKLRPTHMLKVPVELLRLRSHYR